MTVCDWLLKHWYEIIWVAGVGPAGLGRPVVQKPSKIIYTNDESYSILPSCALIGHKLFTEYCLSWWSANGSTPHIPSICLALSTPSLKRLPRATEGAICPVWMWGFVDLSPTHKDNKQIFTVRICPLNSIRPSTLGTVRNFCFISLVKYLNITRVTCFINATLPGIPVGVCFTGVSYCKVCLSKPQLIVLWLKF